MNEINLIKHLKEEGIIVKITKAWIVEINTKLRKIIFQVNKTGVKRI